MEQNACVYMGEDMYVHVCVCLYKNTPYNGVLVTMHVCAKVHKDV